MTTVLEATLKTGEKVYSEFDKLKQVGKYASDVFAGRKPFNAWRVLANVHPASGERVLVRERMMINGTEISKVRQVKRLEDGTYAPVETVQSGERGIWTAPSNPDDAVVGAIMGMQYPIHQDSITLRDYVILSVAGHDGNADEVRYFVDGEGDAGVRSQSGSSWETLAGEGDDDDDTDSLV